MITDIVYGLYGVVGGFSVNKSRDAMKLIKKETGGVMHLSYNFGVGVDGGILDL